MKSKPHWILLNILAIALLAGISWEVQDRIKAQTQLEINQSLSAVLNASHQSLRLWMEEHKSNAALWGQSLEVRQATQDLLGAPQDIMSLIVSHAQPQLRLWLQKISTNYRYQEYFIVDQNDINISASHNVDVGIKSWATTQPGFLTRIRMGETVVSLPQKLSMPISRRDGAGRDSAPTMFLGTPIRDMKGRIIAALVLHLDPAEEFSTVLQRGWFRSSGETFAFDNKGRPLSNSRFDEQLRNQGLASSGEKGILNIEIRDLIANLVPSDEIRPPYTQLPLTHMARLAIAGESGVSLEPYRSYRGDMVVGAWLWDPQLGLGLAAELDASEAYENLNATRYFIFVLTLLVASLLIGMTFAAFANLKRKQAEAKAHKSEQRLEQFFYAAFEKIFFLDQGKIIDANPAALEVLGYSHEQILNQDLLNIISPWSRQGIANFMEVGGDETYEAEVITSTGLRIPVEVRIKMVEHDRLTHKVVGMRDITERLRAEEALNRANEELEIRVLKRTEDLQKANINLEKEISERKQVEDELRKLSRAVEQSPASIMITDLTGAIEYVNPKFVEVSGYSTEEAIGQNPRILQSGQQPLEFYKKLWGDIVSSKEWKGEIHNKKKSGELYWENATISPIVNEMGEITNYVAVKEDITDSKEAADKIHDLFRQNRLLAQQLIETQEMERRHLAQELHDEFGQWLTAIQLHSQVIAEHVKDNKTSTIYRSAVTINDSAKQMNKNARGIIRELRPQTLDDLGLGESLRELVSQWNSHHPSILCEFTIQCRLDSICDSVGHCQPDVLDEKVKITIYRIVQESLTNIAKYSQARHVAVDLSCRQANNEMPDILLVKIEDDGKGMDLSDTPKGVGLVGMRERVLAVGGSFLLDSQPGQGVSIVVKLPINLG